MGTRRPGQVAAVVNHSGPVFPIIKPKSRPETLFVMGEKDDFFYAGKMNVDPAQPEWPGRDRFVLSKGHGVPALYATLGFRGYFDPEECMTLRQLGSRFQGHPDRVRMPAVEASTGSLGQGLSVASGMAYSSKYFDKINNTVFCVCGDG
jgi:transketolase